MDRNLFNVVFSLDTDEFTLNKSCMNVYNLKRILISVMTVLHILINQVKSHINVQNLQRNADSILLFLDTKEFALKKNHMNFQNVERNWLQVPVLLHLIAFILRKALQMFKIWKEM